MQTILESFVEEYGSYDMTEDKDSWSKMLKIFQKGWSAGVHWNQQVNEKYKDFPYSTLRGERSEEDNA